MPKIYSSIAKFKRIEVAIRQARNEHSNVIAEIDKALASKRTSEEIILLNSIRQESVELQKQTVKVLEFLYDGLE